MKNNFVSEIISFSKLRKLIKNKKFKLKTFNLKM